MIHNVLAAVCKALAIDPSRYEGEAKPDLHNASYVRLTLFIAKAVEPKLPRVGKEVDRRETLAAVRKISDLVLAGEKPPRVKWDQLRRTAFAREAHGARAVVTRALALETAECGNNNVCGKGSRAAAVAAATILGEPFVDSLAAELLRLEAVTMIERQSLPAKSAVVASLWRGCTGAKLTHAIVKLESGAYGLLAKTKGRWTWTEGERDDILATVPDALLESAADAVIGGKPTRTKKATAKRDASGETTVLPHRIAGAAHAGGVAWLVSADGRMMRWGGGLEVSTDRVGRTKGIHAASGGAVTWGALLARWNGVVPSTIDTGNTDVTSAVLAGDAVVWCAKDTITFGKKKVAGLPNQRLIVDAKRGHVLACAPLGVRRFRFDGKAVGQLELGGDGHALAPDGARIAAWSKRAVTIAKIDGATELELEVDSDQIDRLVFDREGRILVRYHKGLRVAAFDRTGKQTHRIQARDLGAKGASVDEVFPLARGLLLAFSPYPRTRVLLVDLDARVHAEWELGRLYKSGTSFCEEDAERVLFAYSHHAAAALRC